MRILIAEDDAAIASALEASLMEAGYLVDRVADGGAADQALKGHDYDLLVLDLGMPRLDGMQVLRLEHARRHDTAVMVVTARDSIAERVAALDNGADDYLVKPFSLDEFLARTRALLRRSSHGGQSELSLGLLRINVAARRVWRADDPLELTAREFALLEALFLRQQRVVSRGQLTEALCDWQHDLTDNGLDISVHRLRRKLQGSGTHLRTIRGLGYLLEPVAERDAVA